MVTVDDAAATTVLRLLLLLPLRLSLLLCIRRGRLLLDVEEEKPCTIEPVDAATATAARAVEAVYIRCRPRVRDLGDEDGEGDIDDDMIAWLADNFDCLVCFDDRTIFFSFTFFRFIVMVGFNIRINVLLAASSYCSFEYDNGMIRSS